jgi:prophage regulatory protein
MTAHSKSGEKKGAAVSIEPVSVPPPRLLRLPEVMSRVGLRRSAIYQRMSEGQFPKCRTLGAKCSVWVEAEINEWVESVVRSSQHVDR